MSASRIGLGTAQFGSAYGITNRAGQVDEEEAAAILRLASAAGIDTLDTASLYGTSERVIGRTLAPDSAFRIVTKTVKCEGIDDASLAVERLQQGFAASLAALGRKRVHALLVHDPRDLLGPLGPALWTALNDLKSAGLTDKIGVSIYEGREIDEIAGRYPIDIVQLPFNAVDRRLIDGGQLSRLSEMGIEIHARSIFLQGLLLAAPEDIPDRFGPLVETVKRFDSAFSSHGLTRLEGLLALAFARPEISRFIVGVTSAGDLEAILAAAERAAGVEPFDVDLPPIDEVYLNPVRWPELEEVG